MSELCPATGLFKDHCPGPSKCLAREMTLVDAPEGTCVANSATSLEIDEFTPSELIEIAHVVVRTLRQEGA